VEKKTRNATTTTTRTTTRLDLESELDDRVGWGRRRRGGEREEGTGQARQDRETGLHRSALRQRAKDYEQQQHHHHHLKKVDLL